MRKREEPFFLFYFGDLSTMTSQSTVTFAYSKAFSNGLQAAWTTNKVNGVAFYPNASETFFKLYRMLFKLYNCNLHYSSIWKPPETRNFLIFQF